MSAPTPQQIAAAIATVTEARREAWPPGDEIAEADVDHMTLFRWLNTWQKARAGWIETVADSVAKFSLVADADELQAIVGDAVATLQQSAHEMRVAMLESLDASE